MLNQFIQKLMQMIRIALNCDRIENAISIKKVELRGFKLSYPPKFGH